MYFTVKLLFFYVLYYTNALIQAQLEQVKQKELEVENRQLAEQMSEIVKLNAEGNAAINELKARVRELEDGKEALQNEVQIAKTEVCIAPVQCFLCVSWC